MLSEIATYFGKLSTNDFARRYGAPLVSQLAKLLMNCAIGRLELPSSNDDQICRPHHLDRRQLGHTARFQLRVGSPYLPGYTFASGKRFPEPADRAGATDAAASSRSASWRWTTSSRNRQSLRTTSRTRNYCAVSATGSRATDHRSTWWRDCGGSE